MVIKFIFGKNFNQSLDHVYFPDSLEQLSFEGSFNQPLDNVQFPDSLEKLFFEEFNHSIKNVRFPSKLQTIKFGKMFQQSYEPLMKNRSVNEFTMGNVNEIYKIIQNHNIIN